MRTPMWTTQWVMQMHLSSSPASMRSPRLKSLQNIATIEVADSVPDLSYAPAGGADVDIYDLIADTNSQPNVVSYTRFGEAVSDENNLFVPDLQGTAHPPVLLRGRQRPGGEPPTFFRSFIKNSISDTFNP